MTFLPESDMSLLGESNTLMFEGEEFDLLGEDHIEMCENGYCVRKFIDDVIAENFMQVISKNFRFNF